MAAKTFKMTTAGKAELEAELEKQIGRASCRERV